MREILFRGKRVDNDEWVYGSFCMDAIEQFKGPVGVDGFIRLYDKAKSKMQMHEVDRETVGQYTGLTDKNGRLIFEGDILEANDGFEYFKGEVVFEYGAFGICHSGFIKMAERCCDNFVSLWQLFWNQETIDEPELYYWQVIGNIHDNPELVEGGADG